MSITIERQLALGETEQFLLPSDEDLAMCAQALVKQLPAEHRFRTRECHIGLRIVDADESQALNAQWRDRDKPTNVLSFPVELPFCPPGEAEPVGDLVICAAIVQQEAKAQGKAEAAHWQHMVVHGILHLAGFDHIEEAEAEAMEALEVAILSALSVENPYE